MKRRNFISQLAVQGFCLSASGPAWSMGKNRKGVNYGVSKTKKKVITKIGKRSLKEIRDIFQEELYEKTIPLWKMRGVDWKYGGYLPYINENGKIADTNKLLYRQGRILWLYSYIYNHFDNDNYHLRAAKAGYDFLTEFCMDDNYDWYSEVARDGKPVVKFPNIYASIFMVLGLGEYYRASGIKKALELAVKSVYRISEIIRSGNYREPFYDVEPGASCMGTWLHFLSALTPLLKYTENKRIEKIAQMCVRYILKYHWQPDLGYAFETLQPDLKPHPTGNTMGDHHRTVSNFHAMQAAWMILNEALRTGNLKIFKSGMKFGRAHLEKFWVERNGEQGLVYYFRPEDHKSFENLKLYPSYVMKEVFIFLLLAIEHDPDGQWAAEWFDRAFSYSYEKPLEWPYLDTLHQPRVVMFCLEILNRMIERKGRVSDFF